MDTKNNECRPGSVCARSARGLGGCGAGGCKPPVSDGVALPSPAWVDEVRELLGEAYRFQSTSPKAQENINAALELIDKHACGVALPAQPQRYDCGYAGGVEGMHARQDGDYVKWADVAHLFGVKEVAVGGVEGRKP